jgi:hypothetical protein
VATLVFYAYKEAWYTEVEGSGGPTRGWAWLSGLGPQIRAAPESPPLPLQDRWMTPRGLSGLKAGVLNTQNIPAC